MFDYRAYYNDYSINLSLSVLIRVFMFVLLELEFFYCSLSIVSLTRR